MAVAVGGQRDGRMPESLLYQLERQFEPALVLPVDTPRSEEVPQAMQAGILRSAVLGHHTGGDLRREEAAREDALIELDRTASGREREAEVAVRALEFPLAQLADQRRRQRNRPLALVALGAADSAETVGALPHLQFALLEIDILPT